MDTDGDSSPERPPTKKAKAAVTKPVAKKLAPVKKAAVPQSPLQVNLVQKARVGRAAAKAAALRLGIQLESSAEEELDSDEEEADGESEDEEESEDDY